MIHFQSLLLVYLLICSIRQYRKSSFMSYLHITIISYICRRHRKWHLLLNYRSTHWANIRPRVGHLQQIACATGKVTILWITCSLILCLPVTTSCKTSGMANRSILLRGSLMYLIVWIHKYLFLRLVQIGILQACTIGWTQSILVQAQHTHILTWIFSSMHIDTSSYQ